MPVKIKQNIGTNRFQMKYELIETTNRRHRLKHLIKQPIEYEYHGKAQLWEFKSIRFNNFGNALTNDNIITL